MTDNLSLWNSVFRTDPAHTKAFTKGGGFRGTAIKPFYLIMRATEAFGPVGVGWGWEEIENKLVAGVWCSKVRVWYRPAYSYPQMDGQGDRRAYIEQWGQTEMETTRKGQPYVDEEAPKKAVTDAVTKCLSYLGFGGDVHMGLFDDSKYVEQAAKKETAKARNDRHAFIKAALLASDDPAATWQDYLPEITEFKLQDQQFFDDLVQAGAQRKKQLQERDAVAAGHGEGFAGVAMREGDYAE